MPAAVAGEADVEAAVAAAARVLGGLRMANENSRLT
jgi:hypothetical protein